MKKITLDICASCLRDNPQQESLLQNIPQLVAHYQKHLKPGWFRKHPKVRLVDCLSNCRNGNSVQINRDDGAILLGQINSAELITAIIKLAQKLRGPSPLEVSTELAKYVARVMPPQDGTSNYASE